MKEEIFGPVLPIIPFGEIEEACGQAQSHGKPLALYIFARNNKAIKEIVSHTQAGSTAVNECLLQYFHPQLPFGGSNLSGSGKAHGYYSFLEFSNQRSYLRQSTKWNAFLIAAPPYTKLKQRLVDFIIRWF
jgi:aldehyde dehydrogenase (NAD+)